METARINAEIQRQISYLADDEDYMKKVLAAVKRLVSKREREKEEPVMLKEEVIGDFKEALGELKLHDEGRHSFKSWDEMRKELHHEL